jgi:hypothetical protein
MSRPSSVTIDLVIRSTRRKQLFWFTWNSPYYEKWQRIFAADSFRTAPDLRYCSINVTPGSRSPLMARLDRSELVEGETGMRIHASLDAEDDARRIEVVARLATAGYSKALG